MTAPPFDPNRLLGIAHDLLAGQPDEAHFRSATNRAYYPCHHLARLACRRRWSWLAPEVGAHRAVVRFLRQRNRAFVADRLARLLNLREHADYDLHTPFTAGRCQTAMSLAAELVPRLRTL